jgi:hypothetical protein
MRSGGEGFVALFPYFVDILYQFSMLSADDLIRALPPTEVLTQHTRIPVLWTKPLPTQLIRARTHLFDVQAV